MSEQLRHDRVVSPDGRVFKVSTVRTLAGGGGDNRRVGSPFAESDYLDETPWPFETMIFKDVGVSGQYHVPSPTEVAALAEHERAILLIKEGGQWEGVGVSGFWGKPSTTPAQWFALADDKR